MPFTGKVGDTLHLSDIGGGHRYVILTKPNSDGNVVMANFTSARYWKEWLVTFRPKDDKRLFDKKTTVNYADAQIIPVKKLIEASKSNPRGDYVFCREYHCKRIISKAFQSQYIPGEVLGELGSQYPIESAKYTNT